MEVLTELPLERLRAKQVEIEDEWEMLSREAGDVEDEMEDLGERLHTMEMDMGALDEEKDEVEKLIEEKEIAGEEENLYYGTSKLELVAARQLHPEMVGTGVEMVQLSLVRQIKDEEKA